MLEQAAMLLKEAQDDANDTLEARRMALESLAQGLTTQAGALDESLRSLEERVREMGERASEEAKTASAAVTDAIGEGVRDALERFASASEDMRAAAQSVRGELESTREAIGRGVVDLPDEARESTSAVRRAVSEQVEALRELATIVRRSGSDGVAAESEPLYEFAEARAPAREFRDPAPTPVRAVPVRSEPPRSEPPAFAPRPAPESRVPGAFGASTRPERPEPPARPAPAPTRSDAPTRSEPPTPFNAPLQQMTPGGEFGDDDAASAIEGGRDGWVANLLRRASTDDDPEGAADRDEVEGLNSIALDVVRTLDPNSSQELYRRYRAGERDVFVRRLVQIDGAAMRQRVGTLASSDPTFRSLVDRYAAEFERLANLAAGRGGNEARTLLGSPQGRAYAALGAATGRARG